LPALVSLSMQKGMQESYNVAVIGGAFSGAATALLLRREAPDLRVVVIERSAHFDRKVGEATTEVSGCFLAKRLALTHHLCHHHVVKNGLRFWFSRGSEDDFDLLSRFPSHASSCQVSRASATNHLTGYGWWCWIIPLRGGDYSAGLVYDSRLYSPPKGACLGDRLKTHLLTHPVGKEIFMDAEYIEGEVKAYSSLPYYAVRIAGAGWQIVGDAAAFLDPLYSQARDYCAWTVSAAVDRIRREDRGESCDLKDLNERFSRSHRSWFEALYKTNTTIWATRS
jgi:flavin-dependent dehydrogenase